MALFVVILLSAPEVVGTIPTPSFGVIYIFSYVLCLICMYVYHKKMYQSAVTYNTGFKMIALGRDDRVCLL